MLRSASWDRVDINGSVGTHASYVALAMDFYHLDFLLICKVGLLTIHRTELLGVTGLQHAKTWNRS